MGMLFPIARIMFSLIFITAAPRHFSSEGIGHAISLGALLPTCSFPCRESWRLSAD